MKTKKPKFSKAMMKIARAKRKAWLKAVDESFEFRIRNMMNE